MYFRFDTKRVHRTMETPPKCYKYLNLKHHCKLHVKNARFGILNQHMNGTYVMQSLEKDFCFNTLNF